MLAKKSKKYLPKPFFIILLLSMVLASCSSTTGPVIIRDSTNVGGALANSGIENNDKAKDEKIALVNPVKPDVKTKTVPIIEKLVQQSSQEYQASNYNQSINIAERGLRIDRKEPRFYLALTKAYKGLKNTQQSIFFAKQGLRYAEKNSPIFYELKNLSIN
jgi:hypothetical protein